MPQVYIALGGNIEPAARMTQAARALKARFPDVHFSACYRNPAVGFEGAEFLNAVAGFSTELSIIELLQALHAIEEQCGRARSDPKWGPRAMDMDLLLYGDEVGTGPGYTLPRPDLARRIYMLRPLAELAPQLRHPIAGRTMTELLADSSEGGAVMTRSASDLNAV